MTARPRILAAVGALALGLGGAMAVASPAAAAVDSYTVDNLSPDPAVVGSLPWAVAQAEGDPDASTIDFAPGVTGVIPLNAQFVIAHPVTIIGPGSAALTIVGPPTNETVIDFLNTGVPPIMSASGLTLASSGANLHGISTDDADLTLDDIVANGFQDSGVYAAHANLTASNIEVNGGVLNGLDFRGDSGDSLLLDHVVANNNGVTGAGVNAELIDGTSRIDAVSATGNGGYGVTLTVDGGTLDASGITVDGGSTAGIGVGAIDGAVVTLDGSTVTGIDATGSAYSLTNLGSTLTVSNSTADANDGDGFRMGGDQGGTTTATALTATGNKLGGLFLFALGGSQVAVEASDIEGNGVDVCGCGGPGVTLFAEASAVSITGTTITDNHAKVGAGVSVFGLTMGSTLAISGTTIAGNHAVDGGNGAGGGLAVGDPVFSLGMRDDSTVSVTDSTISGNDAELEGGGVALYDLGTGAPTGSVTFLRTTIDGNSVTGLGGGCGCGTAGGGILLAGAESNSAGGAVLSIQGSTISHNSVVGGDGGGLYLAQGPGYSPALLEILGSTISGNSADGDGAAAFLDAVSADPGTFQVAFRQSTIAGNAVVGGGTGVGGIFVAAQNAGLTLDSTIVADNGSNDLSFDASIGSFAASYSLVQNPVGAGIPLDPAQGNLTGVSAKLGPLANNGGTTQTMLIGPSSPAYNAGDPAFTGAGLLDQRGQARVYQVIDLGAVEWHPALAVTGTELTPRPPLVALLLLLTGLAMVAFSRLQQLRSAV